MTEPALLVNHGLKSFLKEHSYVKLPFMLFTKYFFTFHKEITPPLMKLVFTKSRENLGYKNRNAPSEMISLYFAARDTVCNFLNSMRAHMKICNLHIQ